MITYLDFIVHPNGQVQEVNGDIVVKQYSNNHIVRFLENEFSNVVSIELHMINTTSEQLPVKQVILQPEIFNGYKVWQYRLNQKDTAGPVEGINYLLATFVINYSNSTSVVSETFKIYLEQTLNSEVLIGDETSLSGLAENINALAAKVYEQDVDLEQNYVKTNFSGYSAATSVQDGNTIIINNNDGIKKLDVKDISVYSGKVIGLSGLLDLKVDKVQGKQLSTEDFSTALLNKLNGIAASADENVIESIKVFGYGYPLYEEAPVAVINREALLDLSFKADLDETGKIPASQLPGFVDQIDEYATFEDFPETGMTGRLYIALNTNKTYRWSGTHYVEISESLALGNTQDTAFRGDHGLIAYNHSLVQDGTNPHNTTLANVGNVNLLNPTINQILRFNGTNWVNSNEVVDTNNFTSGVGFNTGSGIFTLTRNGLSDLTVDLDGRYYESADNKVPWADLKDVPTTISGYGITDALNLGNTSTTAYRGDYGELAYNHSQITDGTNPHNTTFANLADKPTTISGFGITDALNLGNTSTTAYRGDYGELAYNHSQITDGTNPHNTTFANLASKPTTLSGFGITDGQPLDADLTAISGLGFASTSFLKKVGENTWALDTNTYSLSNHNHDGIYTPLINGKIPNEYLPPLAITETNVVSSLAALNALTPETGDVAIRTDIKKTFIYDGEEWQEMLTPTDAVLSVNGYTGAVQLTNTDVGAPSSSQFSTLSTTVSSNLQRIIAAEDDIEDLQADTHTHTNKSVLDNITGIVSNFATTHAETDLPTAGAVMALYNYPDLSWDGDADTLDGFNSSVPNLPDTVVVRDSVGNVDIGYDNDDSTLLATTFKDAIDELDAKKANVSDLSSNIFLYSTATLSDIPNYYRLASSLDDPDFPQTAVNVPTGVLSGTNILVGRLIADANLFTGNPGVISVNTIGNIRKTAGNINQDYAEFFFRVFKRDTGGNEELIATSDTTGYINPPNGNYREFSASAILNNGVFSETDRVVVKYYANAIGNGSNYDFQFGGLTPVRTLLPVPVRVLPSEIAEDILVDASPFNKILSANDNNVQEALETLDKHKHVASDILDPINIFIASSGTGEQAPFTQLSFEPNPQDWFLSEGYYYYDTSTEQEGTYIPGSVIYNTAIDGPQPPAQIFSGISEDGRILLATSVQPTSSFRIGVRVETAGYQFDRITFNRQNIQPEEWEQLPWNPSWYRVLLGEDSRLRPGFPIREFEVPFGGFVSPDYGAYYLVKTGPAPTEPVSLLVAVDVVPIREENKTYVITPDKFFWDSDWQAWRAVIEEDVVGAVQFTTLNVVSSSPINSQNIFAEFDYDDLKMAVFGRPQSSPITENLVLTLQLQYYGESGEPTTQYRAVMSVNGQKGDLTINLETLGAAAEEHTHLIADITDADNIFVDELGESNLQEIEITIPSGFGNQVFDALQQQTLFAGSIGIPGELAGNIEPYDWFLEAGNYSGELISVNPVGGQAALTLRLTTQPTENLVYRIRYTNVNFNETVQDRIIGIGDWVQLPGDSRYYYIENNIGVSWIANVNFFIAGGNDPYTEQGYQSVVSQFNGIVFRVNALPTETIRAEFQQATFVEPIDNPTTYKVVMADDGRINGWQNAANHSGITNGSNPHNTTFDNIASKPTTLSGYGITDAINSSLKGSPNGIAELDASGHVPASQLPSFVDDILEYEDISYFPLTGESGKIYVARDTNKVYRWSGTTYTVVSETLALGTTSETAFRGDYGNTAYNHSQISDGSNPHATTFANIASKPTTLAGYGITDAASSTHTHPISAITNLQTSLDNKVEKNANITAGTHTKITYDTKGLITSGTTLSESDIPSLSQSKINNLTTDLAAKDNILTDITTISTSTTLSSSHLNRLLVCTNSSEITITIPQNVFAVGTEIGFVRQGAGTVSIAPGSGITLQSVDTKRNIKGQYSTASIICVSSNVFILAGSLE